MITVKITKILGIAAAVAAAFALNANAANLTDDFTSETPKYESANDLNVYEIYQENTLETRGYMFDKKSCTDASAVLGTARLQGDGEVIYKADGDITGFKIKTLSGEWGNSGIWKISLSNDKENWVSYEAFCGLNTSVSDDENIPNLTVTSMHNKSIITNYQAGAEIKTDDYWGDKMEIASTSDIAAGMSYLKIEVPAHTKSLSYTRRAILNVSIDYEAGARAEVENADKVQTGEAIKINFSKKIKNIGLPVIKKTNGKEMPILSYETASDGMSCSIEAKLPVGEYSVSFIGAATEENENNGIYNTAAFTVVDTTAGEKVFTDDFGFADGKGDLSKIYASSDTLKVCGSSGFGTKEIDLDTGSSNYPVSEKLSYALDAGMRLEKPYIVYKMNGNITDFKFITFTQSKNETLHDNKFKVYISADGETWKQLKSGEHYTAPVDNTYAQSGWVCKSYKVKEGASLPAGQYIKIEYPAAIRKNENGEFDAGWNKRRILNVTLNYEIPEMPDYVVSDEQITTEGTVKTYTATLKNNKENISALMIMALYDGDDFVKASADAKTVNADESKILTASIDTANTANPIIKAFYWSGATMQPLTDLKEVK